MLRAAYSSSFPCISTQYSTTAEACYPDLPVSFIYKVCLVKVVCYAIITVVASIRTLVGMRKCNGIQLLFVYQAGSGQPGAADMYRGSSSRLQFWKGNLVLGEGSTGGTGMILPARV